MRKRTAHIWLVGLTIGLAAGVASAQQSHSVTVVDNAFQPPRVEVQSGDTVVWTHAGEMPHTVTADDGSFDSHPACPPDCMQEGETFSHTFTSPGEVAYHCKVHGGPGGVGQSGVVVVSEAPDPEPEEAEPEEAEPDETADDAPAEPAPDDEARLAETGGVALLGLLAAGLVALGLVMLRRFG